MTESACKYDECNAPEQLVDVLDRIKAIERRLLSLEEQSVKLNVALLDSLKQLHTGQAAMQAQFSTMYNAVSSMLSRGK